MPAPRSLRPIQHATSSMEQIASTSCEPAGLLGRPMSFQGSYGIDTSAVDATAHSATKRIALLIGQLDVANPQADRRPGDTEQRRELLHRSSLFTPKLPGFVPLFSCPTTDYRCRRTKRAAGIEP